MDREEDLEGDQVEALVEVDQGEQFLVDQDLVDLVVVDQEELFLRVHNLRLLP
jgi:hypothetical protein